MKYDWIKPSNVCVLCAFAKSKQKSESVDWSQQVASSIYKMNRYPISSVDKVK